MELSACFIQTIPKVLLHDHLDGGLRSQTVIELAKEQGYDQLPSTNPKELDAWFLKSAQRGSLPCYLEGFRFTCAVMQTKEALERVAYETLEDMKNDNVVYIETRFAPLYHIHKGLSAEDVIIAVLKGLERGKQEFDVSYGLILVALRDMDVHSSLQVAQLAVKFRSVGVVGFDCAGAENGYPCINHLEAFDFLKSHDFNITIHAGEGFGKQSIYQALECGAQRIGHCTKILEDIVVKEGAISSMGALAQYILAKKVPLEMCLTSNLHTGTILSLKDHPFKLLLDNGFRVTLNTDDRLMSGITLSDEYFLAHDLFHLTLRDLQRIAINAMKSAFICYEARTRLIEDVLKPGYRDAERRLTVLEERVLDAEISELDGQLLRESL